MHWLTRKRTHDCHLLAGSLPKCLCPSHLPWIALHSDGIQSFSVEKGACNHTWNFCRIYSSSGQLLPSTRLSACLLGCTKPENFCIIPNEDRSYCINERRSFIWSKNILTMTRVYVGWAEITLLDAHDWRPLASLLTICLCALFVSHDQVFFRLSVCIPEQAN